MAKKKQTIVAEECCQEHYEEQEAPQLTDKEILIQAVKDILDSRSDEYSIEDRRERYGMSADCELIVRGRMVAVIIDNPLDDNDIAVMTTDVEKIIDLFLGGVGKRFATEAKGVKFFEE